MDAEANKATWLGVTLMMVAVLVTAISVTLVFGRGFANTWVKNFSSMVGLRGSEIARLDGTVTKQSAASAQLLLSENFADIDFDTSKVCVVLRGDTMHTDLSDIRAVAHGDVILEVKKVVSTYVVNIHRHDCEYWKIGSACNCDSKKR